MAWYASATLKYYISVNQLVLAEYPDLDVVDGAILDYLFVLCNSRNKKVEYHRQAGWTWIDYKTLLEQMPLLRMKSRAALAKRIEKIEKAGFIATQRIGNQKTYAMLTETVEKLYVYTNSSEKPFVKTNRAVRVDEQPSINKNNRLTTVKKTTYPDARPDDPVEKCPICGDDMPGSDGSYARGRWGNPCCRKHWGK